MILKIIISIFITAAVALSASAQVSNTMRPLRIAADNRHFTAGNEPFFWLGDTGWLLLVKLNREQTIQYLDERKLQGFNVIQVMLLHDLRKAVNRYGSPALINETVSTPLLTPGNDSADQKQYDYWDHVDFVVKAAAKRGLYLALVPVWGTNVKNGWVSVADAKDYGSFLGKRYSSHPNIIWLNGGDINGSDSMNVWNALGAALNANDDQHLITFHPRGRTTSSRWFHNADWLDFNMFQSGHRNYSQDTSSTESRYGEDNWRYLNEDFARKPLRPSLDGEPSYEGIPQGLHDTTNPYWSAADLRRYAYWNYMGGGAGFTYGHNAVMQFFQPGDSGSAYGAKKFWTEAMKDSGAVQMRHLKKLALSRKISGKVPVSDPVENNGERYHRILACRGDNYMFVYNYTGRNFGLRTGIIPGKKLKCSWYDPRTGRYSNAGIRDNGGIQRFDPPGNPDEGNDWVLIVETSHP